MTSPALAGGRLYIRGPNRIECYELRKDLTRLDAKEVETYLKLLKTGPLAQAGEAGLVLRNCAPEVTSKLISDLTRYIEIDAGSTLTGRGKKRTRVKEYERAMAGATVLTGLASKAETNAAKRDAAVQAVAALLEVGTVDQRKRICRLLRAMGPAAKAAMPALRKGLDQLPLHQDLFAAARAIMRNPKYVLEPQTSGGLAPPDLDDDLGLDP